MTHSVRTSLVVAAAVLTLGGAAYAQGASINSQTRGSGAVNVGPGGVGSSLSGSNRTGGSVTAPGAGVRGNTNTTGQGSVGIGSGGARGNVGVGGNTSGGVKLGR
jgi:hypothetical protein